MAVAAQAWPGGGAVAAFCSPHCAPAPASPTWHWEHVPRPEDGQRGQAPPQLSKVRLKDADLLAGGPRHLAPDSVHSTSWAIMPRWAWSGLNPKVPNSDPCSGPGSTPATPFLSL